MNQRNPQASNRRVVWAIYVRISRTDDRLGVDKQLDLCRLQLAAMGVAESDVVVYDENNTSATKGVELRIEYRRLTADAIAGRVHGVMVFVQDRFTRDTDELSAFLKLKIRLATSSTGEIDLTDPDARAGVKIATVNAEREIELIRLRVSNNSAQRASLGMAHGMAPFGWRREVEVRNGRVVRSWDVIDEREAGLLRYAAAELFRGISLRTITAELEAGDVRPRPRTFTGGKYKDDHREASGRWGTTKQIRALLLRECNAGLRLHRGQVLDGVVGDWPAIFDEVTYRRLRLLLTDPSRLSRDKGSAPVWLLSGIATCGVCADGGRILVHTGGKRRPSQRPVYVCVGKPGSKGCFQRHFVDDVDREITRLVAKRVVDPAYADADPTAQLAIDELLGKIDAQRLRMTEAGDAAADEIISLGQLGKINASAKAAIAELDREIDELTPQTVELGIEPGKFPFLPVPDRKAIVRKLFASIAFVPAATHGKSKDRRPEDVGDELLVEFKGRAAA